EPWNTPLGAPIMCFWVSISKRLCSTGWRYTASLYWMNLNPLNCLEEIIGGPISGGFNWEQRYMIWLDFRISMERWNTIRSVRIRFLTAIPWWCIRIIIRLWLIRWGPISEGISLA